MEGRRADTHHGSGEQQHRVAVGEGEQGDTHQGEQHAGGQQVRHGALVGVQADPRLQQRGGDLIDQGDPADLGEAQREVALEHRVDRRQHGLDQVVEQVGEGGGTDDADQKALGLVGGGGWGQGGGRSRHGRGSFRMMARHCPTKVIQPGNACPRRTGTHCRDSDIRLYQHRLLGPALHAAER